MRYANVREFKASATRYFAAREGVVVTRYGKPIAVVTPVPEGTPGECLLRLREVLQEARVSRKEALQLLAAARQEVRRSYRP